MGCLVSKEKRFSLEKKVVMTEKDIMCAIKCNQ